MELTHVDNIVVAGKIQEEHDKNISKFLEGAKLHNLNFNEKKFQPLPFSATPYLMRYCQLVRIDYVDSKNGLSLKVNVEPNGYLHFRTRSNL